MKKLLLLLLVPVVSFGQQSTRGLLKTGGSKVYLDPKGAVADFTKAIELKPNLSRGYFYRGIAKLELEDAKGAIADYNKAVELSPDYASCCGAVFGYSGYYLRGFAKSNLNDYKGVSKDFIKLLGRSPWDARDYFYRGLVKLELEDAKGAVADFTKAIEDRPNYARHYFYRGIAKQDLGDAKGAIADHNRAIKLNPDYATIQNILLFETQLSKPDYTVDNKKEEALKKDNPFNNPIILIVILIIVILVIIYNNRKKKTLVSIPIEKKKSQDSGPLLFKTSIEGFIEKMKEIPDWYQIIQARGNGHTMMVNAGIKVDDYEYWANAHKEEYITKYNNGDLDVEGIQLRIEKFGFIVSEFEKVIKKAAELKFNITTEMHNDYCAARASLLGAKYALNEMNDESEDKVIEIEEKQIKNKFCTNCGTPTLGNNKFCASCGNKLI